MQQVVYPLYFRQVISILTDWLKPKFDMLLLAYFTVSVLTKEPECSLAVKANKYANHDVCL